MYTKRPIRAVLPVFLLGLYGTLAFAEDLTWTGCGITKKAFMAEMVKAYEAKTGKVVKLSGGGATKGIRAASAATSDMGGTCRHWLKGVSGDVHPEEQNAELIQVAWDALVVIAHPSNPVNDISLEQLKKVYQGEITNWKELGGPDRRIALITREGKYSGVGHMFRRLVFGDPEYEFQARSLKVKSTGPLEQKVEKMAGALAVDGISSAGKREIKVLSINGMLPSKVTIGAGTYPLYRPLYLAVHKTKASQEARDFIAFVLSPEGQAVVSQQGTVNLAEGSALEPLWEEKKKSVGL